MTKIQKLKISLVAYFLFLVAVPVFAAEIFYNTETREIRVGSEFQVSVFLNTEKENINAIEGTVRFPADLLEFKKLNDGNSIINFWVERPRIRDKEHGEIVFSGITPGGFLGERWLMFNIDFFAKKEGTGNIETRDIKALFNDGQGTAAEVFSSPLEIVVTSQAVPVSPKKIEDEKLPESFKPEIARDPMLFEGKWFLVFVTQDKGSGIDHYEVKETRQRILTMFSKWILAESPYVLHDQELRSYVSVKAVDRAGNIRIITMRPQNPLRWHESYENLVTMLGGAIIILFFIKKLWTKKRA